MKDIPCGAKATAASPASGLYRCFDLGRSFQREGASAPSFMPLQFPSSAPSPSALTIPFQGSTVPLRCPYSSLSAPQFPSSAPTVPFQFPLVPHNSISVPSQYSPVPLQFPPRTLTTHHENKITNSSRRVPSKKRNGNR